ncbi:hypothetical protein J6590_013460 [Homalodisca vitripennis]|nr:hypothetical protein J6590_013460 [Homalodisca vitripennis]
MTYAVATVLHAVRYSGGGCPFRHVVVTFLICESQEIVVTITLHVCGALESTTVEHDGVHVPVFPPLIECSKCNCGAWLTGCLSFVVVVDFLPRNALPHYSFVAYPTHLGMPQTKNEENEKWLRDPRDGAVIIAQHSARLQGQVAPRAVPEGIGSFGSAIDMGTSYFDISFKPTEEVTHYTVWPQPSKTLVILEARSKPVLFLLVPVLLLDGLCVTSPYTHVPCRSQHTLISAGQCSWKGLGGLDVNQDWFGLRTVESHAMTSPVGQVLRAECDSFKVDRGVMASLQPRLPLFGVELPKCLEAYSRTM